MLKKTCFYILILVLLALSSCNDKKTLKLIKVSEFSSSKVTDTSLVKILKIKNDLDIKISYTLSADSALQQLKDKKTDLVILPNNTSNDNFEFRILVPLLPRILLVMTNKKINDKTNINDLVHKGEVYYEDMSRLDSLVFDKLYYNFDVDPDNIRKRTSEKLFPEKDSDSLKIYVGLIHLNNNLIKKLTNANWYFYSLSNVEYYGKGSRIEGFAMMNSSAHPFIIPMSVYKGKPEKSVLTFAINDVLVCRKDLDEEIAYGITKTIIENKSHLSEMNSIYNLLNFDYDSQVLLFPKHNGTKKFLNRDEPPLWYKYVNMIWPLISISVVIFGVFTSVRQILKRRKKQKIEMYYNKLLEIRDKSDEAVDVDSFIEILKELKKLRSKATKSLADKKLDPGESFNIFLALYNEVREDLAEKIREMRLKEKR